MEVENKKGRENFEMIKMEQEKMKIMYKDLEKNEIANTCNKKLIPENNKILDNISNDYNSEFEQEED